MPHLLAPSPRVGRLAAALFGALVLSACADLHFQAQAVELQRDVEADSLRLELVYDSVAAGNRPWPETLAVVERVAAGGRVVWPFYPLFRVDFDELANDAAGPADDAEHARRVRRFCEGVTVEDARVFVDGAGRLGIRQRVRIADATEALALFDGWLHRTLVDDPTQAVGLHIDDESRRRLLDEAQSRTPWVRWKGTALEVSLPLSEQDLRQLRAVEATPPVGPDSPSEEERERVRVSLEILDGLRPEDGRVVVRFEPDYEGVFRWAVGEREDDYDERLLERLRAAGFELDR